MNRSSEPVALVFALPAYASTWVFRAETASFQDFGDVNRGLEEDLGTPPFTSLETGTHRMTLTVGDSLRCTVGTVRCDASDSWYSLIDGVFSGGSSGSSEMYLYEFNADGGTLVLNNEWSQPESFRVMTMDLQPVPLPAPILFFSG